MKVNEWLKVKSKCGNFVGQLNFIGKNVLSFRTGLNDVLILSSIDLIDYEYVKGRDIEIRKNGKYYVQ